MYTLTDTAAHKMYTYSSTRSGGRMRKRKGKKKCAPILATNSERSRSKREGCRQSAGGVWVHIGVHNLKRMPAKVWAGIGVHNLQQVRTGYI